MRAEDLQELAALARLRLSADELSRTGEQVRRLLQHFALLQGVNTDGVEPSPYPRPMANRTRPDLPEAPLTQEQVLANAPATRSGCFLVPRVVEG